MIIIHNFQFEIMLAIYMYISVKLIINFVLIIMIIIFFLSHNLFIYFIPQKNLN